MAPTHEIAPLYHNRLVHALMPPPREFLYARFAHGVFPMLAGFFGGGVRRVCTRGREGWECEWVDWGDILRWRPGSGVVGVAVGEVVKEEEGDGGEEGGEGEEEYVV